MSLSFEKNNLIKKKYWDFQFEEDTNIKSENEYIEELTYLLNQSVNRQIISDVDRLLFKWRNGFWFNNRYSF